MLRFVWKAVDLNGILRRGVWEEEGITEVQTRLRKEGYFPVWVRAKRTWKSIRFPLGATFQWTFFSRRLAILLEAGIPLLQALEIITFQVRKLTMEQELWKSVKQRVESGSDLSEALSVINPSPSSFVLAMIKAGEYTGSLAKVLSEVADELEQEQELHKKIKAALAYPLLLSCGVVVVLYVLSVWVLPMYEKLFLNIGSTDLPMVTKVIFASGHKLPVLLGCMLGLGAIFMVVLRFSNPDDWKLRLERLLERLPIIGKVYRLRDLVQFSRMLGSLIAAGIPLLEALRLTAGTLRTPMMQELTNQLLLSVRQGKRMAPLLRASHFFPKEGAEMIAVAEETGQLERILNHVNQLFRQELEDQLTQLLRMIEPALILALAGLIGLVASGVMIPIFDLSSHLE